MPPLKSPLRKSDQKRLQPMAAGKTVLLKKNSYSTKIVSQYKHDYLVSELTERLAFPVRKREL